MGVLIEKDVGWTDLFGFKPLKLVHCLLPCESHPVDGELKWDLAMMAVAFNANTWEVEVKAGSLRLVSFSYSVNWRQAWAM